MDVLPPPWENDPREDLENVPTEEQDAIMRILMVEAVEFEDNAASYYRHKERLIAAGKQTMVLLHTIHHGQVIGHTIQMWAARKLVGYFETALNDPLEADLYFVNYPDAETEHDKSRTEECVFTDDDTYKAVLLLRERADAFISFFGNQN